VLTISPFTAWAALVPASTAARHAATSPLTNSVTSPLPTLRQPWNSTLAALHARGLDQGQEAPRLDHSDCLLSHLFSS
jgi:hypothetical protein